jgi:hypothetical protein
MAGFNGLGMGLGNLSRLSDARTRSISPENFSGEPGKGGMATEGTGAAAARDLGQGWKVSPSVQIGAGQTFVLAAIHGPGANELYRSQTRFGMYRWHIPDPIRFQRDVRVTLQALGWRSGGRYLPLQCDIASVAFWYQPLPTAPFPELPDRDYLEII